MKGEGTRRTNPLSCKCDMVQGRKTPEIRQPTKYCQSEVNTMSTNEIETKIRKMQEWEQLAADAKAEAEALRDEIKAEMLAQQTEEMTAGKFIVRWTSVLSNRFDTTTFKREHAEMYKQYTKQSTSRRFSVA